MRSIIFLVPVVLLVSCSRQPARPRSQPSHNADAAKPVRLHAEPIADAKIERFPADPVAVAAGGDLVEWRLEGGKSLFAILRPNGRWETVTPELPDDARYFDDGGSEDVFGRAFAFDGAIARTVECRSGIDMPMLVVYRPGEKRWQIPPPFVGMTARRAPAVAFGGGRLWLVGGEGCGEGKAPLDGAVFDPATNVWNEIPPAPGPRAPRAGEAHFVDGRLLALTDAVHVYDPRRGAWTSRALPAGLEPGYRAVAAGDSLVLLGASALWRFTPGDGRWRRLPERGAPRAPKAAVWTGRYLVVRGEGVNLYDPARDRWVNPSVTPVPAWREGTVGLWTGAEAIFWSPSANSGFRLILES